MGKLMRAACVALACLCTDASPYPSNYSTTWLAPSPNGTGTNKEGHATFFDGMPLGNGDVAVLAWANATAGPDATYTRVSLEGYCAPAPTGQWTAPLTLWYSSARQDYQVCGTAACFLGRHATFSRFLENAS